MQKRIQNIIIGTGIFLALFFSVGGYFINKYFHKWVKSHPKMYAYHTYYGPPNSVLIIEDLKYKKALIKFYKTISKDPESNPPLGVPLKILPMNVPVYVIGYTEDSLLAKVVVYNIYGQLGESLTIGWVYRETLHKEPPKK